MYKWDKETYFKQCIKTVIKYKWFLHESKNFFSLKGNSILPHCLVIFATSVEPSLEFIYINDKKTLK